LGSEEMGTEELGLPASVQAALGELASAAKEGLLALSVGVGLGVLAELMETEVDEVVQRGRSASDREQVSARACLAGRLRRGGRESRSSVSSGRSLS
jgi:hypothetical protein